MPEQWKTESKRHGARAEEREGEEESRRGSLLVCPSPHVTWKLAISHPNAYRMQWLFGQWGTAVVGTTGTATPPTAPTVKQQHVSTHLVLQYTETLILYAFYSLGVASRSQRTMSLAPALVPVTVEKKNNVGPNTSNTATNPRKRRKRTRQYRPYISLVPESGKNDAVEFGRTAILTSQFAHCGCLWSERSEANTLTQEPKSDPDAGKTQKNNTGAQLNLCRRCREAERWCVRFLSRKLMRITSTRVAPPAVHKSPTPDCNCNDRTSDCTYTYRVQIRGENTPQFVSIRGSECMEVSNNCNGDDSTRETDGEWKTVGTVTLGSIISFRYPGENSAARGGGERSSKSLHFQLCMVSVTETEFASGGHVETAVQPSGYPKDCQAHDTSMGMPDGSDDAGNIGSNPLTQRPGISTPRIGQNGNDSERLIVLEAAVTAPAACLSPNAGSVPNASSSSSTQEVPSSIPQNHQEAACMPPVLSPHCRPWRSPLSQANSSQASPTSTEVPSSCPPPRQLSTVDHQGPSPADSAVHVRESITSNLETGASHPRASVSSDGSQDPTFGTALHVISQGPQLSTALHDDTNTPRAASQRSIIDLMTPESSGAPLTLRKDDGDQESSQRSTGVDMEVTPTDAAAARRSAAGGKAHPSPIDLTTSPAPKSSSSSAPFRHSVVVYFLKLGRGMAQSRIRLLSKTLEKKNADVRIVESFASSPAPPTHVVIDSDLSAELAASSLGFNSAEKMASHFCSKKIHAVTPHWVLTCTCENLQDDPGIDCLWGGFRRYRSAESIKTKVRGTEQTTCTLIDVLPG